MSRHPIRILHFIGDLGGGDGRWLRNMLQYSNRDQLSMDFLVTRHHVHTYDSEIIYHGSRIIHSTHLPGIEGVSLNFPEIIRRFGPYDIFHTHANYSSGYTIYLAKVMGIPVRIAHSHLDTRSTNNSRSLPKRMYQFAAEFLVRKYATAGVGISERATTALFGPDWRSDPRWRVMYYGLDFTPFYQSVDSAVVRAELNIPEQAFVIGHIGTFNNQKNHSFFVDVALEIIKREPAAHFLLIGDGPLRSTIEQKIQQEGCNSHFLFTGIRTDVPRLLLGVIDVLLFPSLYEGLGIALLEAQAAGVPYVCSDVIPEETNVVPALERRLPLSSPTQVWAESVLENQNIRTWPTQGDALRAVEDSIFSLDGGMRDLNNLYEQLVAESGN